MSFLGAATALFSYSLHQKASPFSICDDIADLSDPKEAENFKKAAVVFYKQSAESADLSEAIPSVMMYENIAQ